MVYFYMHRIMIWRRKNGVIKEQFSRLSGIITQKSKTILQISPQKPKKFQKNLGVLLRGLGTIDSCKKPEVKNLRIVSL